jgi:hypothetical protein
MIHQKNHSKANLKMIENSRKAQNELLITLSHYFPFIVAKIKH